MIDECPVMQRTFEEKLKKQNIEKSKDEKNAENYRRKLEEQDRCESLQLNLLSGSDDDNVFKSEQDSVC